MRNSTIAPVPQPHPVEEHRGSRRGFLALLLALPLLAGACAAGGEGPSGPSGPAPSQPGNPSNPAPAQPGTPSNPGPAQPGTPTTPGTGGGPGTQPPMAGSQFVGVYHLESINGNGLAIPYAQHWLGQDTYGRQYVEEGKIEFFANNTYRVYLKKALTIGNGPRVYAPYEETGTWSYTSSGMSGTVLLGPSGPASGYTVEATPYTITDTRHLDPFSELSENLVFVKE